jgi:radical SAM superfamily enzyme YgiQ (UPF0313 family)
MNCLLVYPQMPDSFYALKHFVRIAGKKAPFPPLGLLTVASMLPQEWNAKVCDCNVEPLTNKMLEWADLVLLSAMNVQEESVRLILSQCEVQNVKVVAGGPLFTHEHERFSNVDYFVLNEAEITLPLFLADFKAGTPQKIYTSTAFADVTQTPMPRYELVDLNNYLYAIIQYSRGCPYLCDFCDVTALFGRKPRVKSPERVIEELELIRKHSKFTTVLFADDNLIGNKRVLKNELLPALIEWQKRQKYGFWFATQVTINVADDDELLSLLAEAGFRSVFIGIETPQEVTLKDSRKTQNLKRDLLKTIHSLHEHGFTIYGGFIVGFDSDTEESFETISNFIQESGIPVPIVNVLKAPPGTELFDRMKREGRLSKDFAFEEGDTNIHPMMPLKDLIEGFVSVVNNIYMPDKTFERFKTYLNQHQFTSSKVKIRAKITFGDILQLIKILVNIGIVSKHRGYFWRVMIYTYRNHREFLSHGLFLALMGVQMHLNALHLIEQAQLQLAQIKPQQRVA